MKLYYFQPPDGLSNFGDSLNPWLWNQLLPNVFDEDETTAFLGIGTLLNNLLPHRLPKARRLIIFSSGVGYGTGLPTIDESWIIYCLRGALSAKKLGLPAKFVCADGAILIRRLFNPTTDKINRFAFMPHIHHAKYGGEAWKSICEQIGFSYIDPRWSTEQVLTAISQTEILLAEAMHGAIAADALRVPWIPVISSAWILPFKWQDWCSSIDIEYQPNYVMPLVKSYPRIARGIRSGVRATLHWVNWLKQEQFSVLGNLWEKEQNLAATQLVQIAKTVSPNLSNEHRLEQLTVELEEKLYQFKADVVAGKYD